MKQEIDNNIIMIMNLPCVVYYIMSCHMRLYNNCMFLITSVRHEPSPTFRAFFTKATDSISRDGTDTPYI